MKRTSLYEIHNAAGATTVPFAGWEMPVSYAGTVSEVDAVRTRAGIFDVSHMGEVRISGRRATDFVQRVTTNDVTQLQPGEAQYSLLLNEQGGVVDDIIVYCSDLQVFLIVLNAGCKDKDWGWLQQQVATFSDVTLDDVSDETALLAVQGPEAVTLVAGLAGNAICQLKRFAFLRGEISGMECILSRTGYTGEDGFEIFCGWQNAPAVWNTLVDAGATPAGLAARDVLRLEAAYPLYGHELDEQTTPLESGVGWAVKTGKGEFIGRQAVLAQKEAGIPRKLVGLRMEERAIPREHFAVLSADGGMTIGQVTSGTYSPTLKAGIAMVRIDVSHAKVGTEVCVDIRGRQARAKVVRLPFYRNGV